MAAKDYIDPKSWGDPEGNIHRMGNIGRVAHINTPD